MDNITTRKWEAWVNTMPIQPTQGGTLHVIGEVDTHSPAFAHLRKTVPQGTNHKILMLDLLVEIGIVPATNPQHVHYTEELLHSDQYTNIEILYKGKIIKTINKIPIIK